MPAAAYRELIRDLAGPKPFFVRSIEYSVGGGADDETDLLVKVALIDQFGCPASKVRR
jgi:hypothetical protein